MKKQILFVDDEQRVLDSLDRMLRPQRDVWEMTYVNHPETAWKQVQQNRFDALVFDIKMPGISGLELLERIRQTKRDNELPVVVLTGLSDHTLKRQALDLGATDLLNKPVDPEDLLARLRSVLRLKAYHDELKTSNDRLEQRVQQRTADLFNSRLDIIWRLGEAAEYRDEETGNHVIRVGCFSREVAEVLRMDRRFVETLFLAAPLHDIGKIGIPDAILLKPGPLSPEQRQVMEQHCLIGARILRENPKIRTAFLRWRGPDFGSQDDGQDDGRNNPLLEMAASIALTHHERWDGTGYPQGLSGENIPLESRIVAACDAFDAMCSERPYKDPFSEEKALATMRAEAGKHFDPKVYAAFIEALPEIRAIREQFADQPNARSKSEEPRNEESLVCG